MKVVLLVRSLDRGGAERQLVMLARVLRDCGVDVVVVVFYDGGPFERDLVRLGIRVRSLGKAGRWDLVAFGFRFARVIKEENPDLLYGFVVTPNLLASAIKPIFPRLRVVWGVRSAHMDLSAYDWATRLVYPLEATLSSLPDLIIVNSRAGQRHLKFRGFPERKVAHVPNGIDVEQYAPSPAGRARLRAAWSQADDSILVGIVARPDPVKAHDIFVRAAKQIRDVDSRFHFICVGVDGEAATRLQALSVELNIADALRIEEPRDDLADVYSALDIHVMCSHSEGFPNVVAEAMACGVPCVVTDVGDAAEIVADTGEIVQPANPKDLARGVQVLSKRLDSEASTLRVAARARIVREYSLDALARNTLAELTKLVTP